MVAVVVAVVLVVVIEGGVRSVNSSTCSSRCSNKVDYSGWSGLGCPYTVSLDVSLWCQCSVYTSLYVSM